MDQEFILKAILILSISISILLFTYYVVKLLISVRKMVDETTNILEDTSEVSGAISDGVKSMKKSVVKGSVLGSIFSFALNMGLASQLKDWLMKKNKKRKEKSGDQ